MQPLDPAGLVRIVEPRDGQRIFANCRLHRLYNKIKLKGEGRRIIRVNKTLEKARNAAFALSRKDRAILAEELFESIDDDEELTLSPEWIEEIERRVELSRMGKVKTIPAEQVFKKLRAKLRK